MLKLSVVPITGLFFLYLITITMRGATKVTSRTKVQVDLKLRLKTLYKCSCHLCFPSEMSISDCGAQKPPEMPLQRPLRDSDTQRHRGAAPRLERPHAPSSLSTHPSLPHKNTHNHAPRGKRTSAGSDTPPPPPSLAKAHTHRTIAG